MSGACGHCSKCDKYSFRLIGGICQWCQSEEYRANRQRAAIAAIEQRLRDIAAGACGCGPDDLIGTIDDCVAENEYFYMAVRLTFGYDKHPMGHMTFADLAAAIWEHQHAQ